MVKVVAWQAKGRDFSPYSQKKLIHEFFRIFLKSQDSFQELPFKNYFNFLIDTQRIIKLTYILFFVWNQDPVATGTTSGT